MSPFVEEIRNTLQNLADPATLANGQRLFKETIHIYGVRVPLITRVSKDYFEQIPDRPKDEIFSFCEELWESGIFEESIVACNWSYYICDRYSPEDFGVFQKWVENYVRNWATCDTLCNHTVGTFVEMYPEFVSGLKEWAHSDNRWERRAAAVTLIIPARKGLFLQDIFDISGILLMDEDDLVRKGYGWMLKAASESHPREVFEYVMAHKAGMPRTALRYAIEKMPPEWKTKAMEK